MSRNVLQKENRTQVSLALSFCSGCIKKSASLKLELYEKKEGNPKTGKRETGNRNLESESGKEKPESGIENGDRKVHFKVVL